MGDHHQNNDVFDANFFHSLKESLKNLESLDLYVFKNFFDNFNFEPIHLKNMKNLRLEFNSHPIHTNLNSVFSFDQLETITFPLYQSEYFYKIIQKNPTISTLGLLYGKYAELQCLEPLTKICPSVTKINCIYNIKLDELHQIDNIMVMFNTLKF